MKVDLTKDEVASLRSVAKQSIILFTEGGAEFQDPISLLLVEALRSSLLKLERASLGDQLHEQLTAVVGPKVN